MGEYIVRGILHIMTIILLIMFVSGKASKREEELGEKVTAIFQ